MPFQITIIIIIPIIIIAIIKNFGCYSTPFGLRGGAVG
jgi:hypothetical protein